jgi:hypothetical protein
MYAGCRFFASDAFHLACTPFCFRIFVAFFLAFPDGAVFMLKKLLI